MRSVNGHRNGPNGSDGNLEVIFAHALDVTVAGHGGSNISSVEPTLFILCEERYMAG